MSPEPSLRRHRSDTASGFQPVVAGISKIAPLLGIIDSQDRPSTSRELERNTPVLSQVPFQLEDNIEVEEISKSVVALNSPLPSDHPNVLLFVGTLTHKRSSLGLHPYIPSMTTTGSMAPMMSVTSMQTPISIQGGGTISIPFISPDTAIFGSTSISSMSVSSQATASGFGFIPYGMSAHGIPLVPLSIPSTASTSMMSGSTSF